MRPRILATVFYALAMGCEPEPSLERPERTDASVPDADPVLFILDVPRQLPPPPDTPPLSMPPFPHPSARVEGCPEGMVRVSGRYCLEATHTCIEWHPDYLARQGDKTVSERCLRYLMPARCARDHAKNIDFCIDRYEYPNQVGELPRVLTSWREARRLCEREGKRLCSVEEFNFACEGPQMNPYATGYQRDPVSCNIDKPYYQPDHSRQMLTYRRCLKEAWCRRELQRLDQRHAIGRRLDCVSWAGVVDLNGNVNEWVEIRRARPPDRSGLKGGWWGPVRNRCRPTVTFHKEFDYGYEAGFRCCRSIGPERRQTRYAGRRYTVSPEQLHQESKEREAERGKSSPPVSRSDSASGSASRN